MTESQRSDAGSPGARVVRFVREHSVYLALLGIYFASAAMYFAALDRWEQWTVRPAYPLWAIAVITFSAGRLLAGRLAAGAASPLWRLESVAGALLVVLAVTPFQTTFSSVKRTIDDVRGFPWDSTLASLDRSMHFGRHPWEWLVWIVENRWLLFWIDRLYLWWFPVVSAYLFWLAWTPLRRLRQQALISTVLVWAVCGNVAAMALASAGPCYYEYAAAEQPDPYKPLFDRLDLYATSGEYVQARVVQRLLWDSSPENPVGPLRGISAMPSVHVAMAVLMALVASARHRLAGAALWAFAAVMMIGSVVLGWHYAVDGYVGAAMAWGIWRISGKAANWAVPS